MSSNTEVTIINWFVVCNEVGEAQESSFVAQSFALITSVLQLLKKSSSKPLLKNYLLISSYSNNSNPNTK
jgi:predicted RNase H-like nuclease